RSTATQEGLMDSTSLDVRTRKIPHIIDSQYNRRRRVGLDVIREGGMREEKSLESPPRIEIIAAHQARVIDPAPLGEVVRVVRVHYRWAKVPVAKPDEAARRRAGIHKDPGDIAQIVNLLGPRLIPGARIIKRGHQLKTKGRRRLRQRSRHSKGREAQCTTK